MWRIFLLSLTMGTIHAQYEPNWKSLDTRPLPSWFDEAKIGVFIHWGVYSVPSVASEWFWNFWQTNSSQEITEYIENNFPPGFTYQEFAKDFTAELLNVTRWVDIFIKSGAKYVILTSKHHEGFSLWPSKYSYSWNAKDLGPHRDIVEELGEAVRKSNLTYGLYHSLFEWYHPLFLADQANNFTTQTFVDNKIMLEMKELVNRYQPLILWSDGSIAATDTYWKSTEFIAWLYNESPVKDFVVTNDRWGDGVVCKHGDFYTCDDRYDPGTLQNKKWENALTIDKKSWGFRRNAALEDYMTPLELLTVVVRTVSCGGNVLINVGPTKDGVITPIFEERLSQLGDWLEINGEAIYNSKPWTFQNDSLNSDVWYTTRDNTVYAINLDWPQDNDVILGSVIDLFKSTNTTVALLGNEGTLKWTLQSDRVVIQLPNKAIVKSVTAWVLKVIAF
ncbi:hypothetical protein ABEB36_002865 [Hypothenemus hampei]|uniref:Putative alpha-L-fucosidase n=1 Tax=Hypothenemus hampei TaxID=57062 RepID=A0ABD1FAD3_HYPHA